MFIGRLILGFAACLTLSSCGLINTALKLAPYLLMFADEEQGGAQKMRQRAQEVETKGHFTPPGTMWKPAAESQMAAR